MIKKSIKLGLGVIIISFFTSSILYAVALTSISSSQEKLNFLTEVNEVFNYVSSDQFNRNTCESYLNALSNRIANTSIQNFDYDTIKKDSPEILNKLWLTRLCIHNKLPDIVDNCVSSIRNAFRAIRSIEDYLGELDHTIRPLNPGELDFAKQKIPIIENPHYYSMKVAPKFEFDRFKPFEFKNGDIILSRGVSFVSATIARIGDIDTQFSHIVFVRVDEKTKEMTTIESYIGKGVQFYTRDEALRNENSRLLVLRAKDQSLAVRASDFISNLTKKRIDSGNLIPYDYEQNFDEHSALSCAEVSRYAYEVASNGKVILPMHPSIVSLKNEDFLSNIGLKKGTTFSPGDLETDPRFEIVLEWRDYRLIRDSRYRDAILSSVIKWMNDQNYVVYGSLKTFFAKNILWTTRKTFLWPFMKFITRSPEFSPEVSRETLSTFVFLNSLGDLLLEKLVKEDKKHEAQTGYPMTTYELEKYLEQVRSDDLSLYMKFDGSKSLFHDNFRPEGLYFAPKSRYNKVFLNICK